MRRCLLIMMSLAATLLVAEPATPVARPSVLFCIPSGGDMSHDWVDWQWLRELHEDGFEIDVTEQKGFAELSWERLSQFQAIVLFASPDAFQRTWHGDESDPTKVEQFRSLITRYAEAGGGILLMPSEVNIRKQALADITSLIGARLPVEEIVETNPAYRGLLSHTSRPIELAYTPQVEATPVSQGVDGIWYPYSQTAYNCQMTCPLELSPEWQVVVRASQTAHTQPHPSIANVASFDVKELEDFHVRDESVTAPPLFAIREWKAGRVALCAQWRMFSIGNGTQWIYNREVLSRGIRQYPSDFGQLLRNTLRWLAGSAGESLGGYVTPAGRLLPKNLRPGAQEVFDKMFQVGNFDNAPPAGAPLWKGIIGARTQLSGGSGSVADYAAAAREAGLGFVVFLEDLAKLTPETWAAFQAECAAASSEELVLYPGIIGKNNIGNTLFLFGPDQPFPPENCLKRRANGDVQFFMQQEDMNGRLMQGNTPLFGWLLNIGTKRQIGYCDFAGAPHGMSLPELRLCGMAALQTWRDGKLVEEMTDDYLLTAKGTLPPTPVAVNLVMSPESLKQEVAANHGLTYAQGSDHDKLFGQALHYTAQYSGVNTFPSTGPKILAWPSCARCMTFGAESYVTEASIMTAPLKVQAEAGLREVAIYNGDQLYRRFLPNGAKTFETTLVLTRTVQKMLCVVAIDEAGGRAVSFPRRSWKTGSISPEFCSDHINDMIGVTLARGPFSVPVVRAPALPVSISGWTWDGGPKGVLPFFNGGRVAPFLRSSTGTQDAMNMIQTPELLAADELAIRVSSVRRGRLYQDPAVVYNPWRTFGPTGGMAELFTCALSFSEWIRPSISVVAGGYGFGAERNGMMPTLWQAEITMLKAQTVDRLELFGLDAAEGLATACIVSGADPASLIDLTQLRETRRLAWPTGQWIGIVSSRPMNPLLLYNQDADLIVELRPANGEARAGLVVLAAMEGTPVQADQQLSFAVAGLGMPMDVDVRSAAEIKRYADYLAELPGLTLSHGKRQPAAGVLAVEAIDGWMALETSREATPPSLTIPLEIRGLNPRWSAGHWQHRGYTTGYYGDGNDQWRAIAVDADGKARIPVFAALADRTELAAGHPVIADERGADLFIQVTRLTDTPATWHVAVNNPTDAPITTQLSLGLPVPGLKLPADPITLAPGDYRQLSP